MRMGVGWGNVRAWLGWVGIALALAVAGCGGTRTAAGNDVEVSGSAPTATLAPGQTVVFTMTVRNLGNNAASDIRLVDQLGSFLVLTDVACTAAGGAVCPATGTVMTVPTLPAGSQLTFTVSATINVIQSGTISNTMTATAAEDIGRTNNSATATATVVATAVSLGITQDAAATVPAGSSATFRVVVQNPTGGTVVSNAVIQWAATAAYALDGITYTCTATAGAACPADQAPSKTMSFTVPTLGSGRSLVFTFTVPVPATARGALSSTASVTADGDLDTTNNGSNASTLAIDSRNGVYKVYAADGRQYQLTIDFDAGQYTMAGNGGADTRGFAADAQGGGYTGKEDARLRLRSAQDVVVGAHAFAAGVLPYVAARTFATSLATIGGAFNVMSRSAAADGTAAVTHAGTARVSGNTLQVCQDDNEVVQAQACGVGSLKSYTLSVSDDLFTAIETAGGKAFSFRLARSGAADVLLAAGPARSGDANLEFSIGLAESAGLVGGTVFGPAVGPQIVKAPAVPSAPDWVQIDLTRTTYLAQGANIADLTGLFRLDVLDAPSPVAMLQGAPMPKLEGAPIWVMQSFPFVVVVGATTSEVDQANASGLLQIAVP
jgi:uncharacterized repeat protein (TIGR01451 family)